MRANLLLPAAVDLHVTSSATTLQAGSRPIFPTATISNEDNIPEGDMSPLPPPPTSAVNLYELSFGTVAGVCAGVFIKKGAKAVAFCVGGVFVLLQVSWAVFHHFLH